MPCGSRPVAESPGPPSGWSISRMPPNSLSLPSDSACTTPSFSLQRCGAKPAQDRASICFLTIAHGGVAVSAEGKLIHRRPCIPTFSPPSLHSSHPLRWASMHSKAVEASRPRTTSILPRTSLHYPEIAHDDRVTHASEAEHCLTSVIRIATLYRIFSTTH